MASGGDFGIVGLTGGIGSGKSTVARFFAELGVPVVDADRVAREVVAPGTEGLAAIVEAFGADVLAADGELDRKALGAIVFADPDARRRLEAITHPRIFTRSRERFAELAAAGHPYAIYEAALLVENGSYRMFDGLIVVAASPEVQRARVEARDRLAPEEVRARIEAQLPLDEKIAVADHVIWNDGGLAETRARTEEVHRELSARFGRAA
jgi:dephospho-CoA kinase